MRHSSLFVLALTAAFASGQPALAEVKLPSIFSDHMVLQSGVAAPVWGWAGPGETVSVTIAGQTKSATADAQGKWTLQLDPLKAGGPYTLEAKGSNTVTVSDVLAGEVWLGSGQSNMAFPMRNVDNYANEKAAANYPQMRIFRCLTQAVTPTPQDDVKGVWEIIAPENVDAISAVLYFFGRELHQTLNVPVGLIESAVGGTPIELWIDEATQKADPDLKKFFEVEEAYKADFNPAAAEAKNQAEVTKEEAATKTSSPPARSRGDPVQLEKRNTSIGGLFNSKIAPLIPYAIRGVIWYQGEANGGKPEFAPFYQYQLPLLVEDWRQRWGYDFPFAWVQLPNLNLKTASWPVVREAMLKTLRLPKTGMAITIDIGGKMHPTDKQDVGHRLALWALGTVYGKDNATSGPLPAGSKTNGSEMVLSFSHADGGLVAKSGDLRGFVVAGADKQWKPASARIDGTTVVVSSPEVKMPVAARYDWAPDPNGNLYNGAGLPASPFRTDDDPIEAPAGAPDVSEP